MVKILVFFERLATPKTEAGKSDEMHLGAQKGFYTPVERPPLLAGEVKHSWHHVKF